VGGPAWTVLLRKVAPFDTGRRSAFMMRAGEGDYDLVCLRLADVVLPTQYALRSYTEGQPRRERCCREAVAA